MPRTKLDKFSTPKLDPVKGLILTAAKNQGKTQEDCAALCKMPLRTYQLMISKHSDEWTMRRILDMAKGLRIPIEELRPMIRY